MTSSSTPAEHLPYVAPLNLCDGTGITEYLAGDEVYPYNCSCLGCFPEALLDMQHITSLQQ